MSQDNESKRGHALAQRVRATRQAVAVHPKGCGFDQTAENAIGTRRRVADLYDLVCCWIPNHE